MNDINKEITPFKDYDQFMLYQNIKDVRKIITNNGLDYISEIWDNKECTNPVPWTIIKIENKIHLFFANDKLFKIYLCNGCSGKLPNGISIGMKMEDALKLDNKLTYDDWNEIYQSPKGYWLEDDICNGTIISVCIFIKEILNEDLFDCYNW